MSEEMQLPFLGQIPLDSELTRACDEGRDINEVNPTAASAIAFEQLAKGLCNMFFNSLHKIHDLTYFSDVDARLADTSLSQ